MTNKKNTQQNQAKPKQVIVFGSSGLIGKKICEKALLHKHKLIEAGRSKINSESEFLESDFNNLESISESLLNIKLEDGDAIVFSHRARNEQLKNEQNSLYANIQVEINPYFAAYKILQSRRFSGLTLNVVNITSNSYRSGGHDISFSYHVTKAAQAAAGQMLAYIPQLKTFSNNISFGETINNDISSHSNYHSKLFNEAKKCLNGKALPSTDQIASLAIRLCNADQYGLSGQTLCVDSGLSHLSIESVLRSIAH